MYLRANAKINVSLNVNKKRKDGYHELDMVVLPIALHDIISVSRLPKKRNNQILINDKPIETSNNLCLTLVNKIVEKFNIKKRYEFAIYKEIPFESGLGGGSSDAVAIYKFYKKKFKLKMSENEELEFLKRVGADLPFFLFNTPSRVKGIGEIIEPINVKRDYYVLIVKPKQGLLTKDVFKTYDSIKGKNTDINKVVEALEDGNDGLLQKFMSNALEDAAISKCKKINEIKEYLINNDFPLTLMSGSGSSVFSLSHDKFKTKEMVNNLKKLNYAAFYTKILKE